MQENVDWWDSLTKEQISGIEKGLADVKSGRIISSEKVWEKYGRKPY
jgi:predicted transcriptional regulator